MSIEELVEKAAEPVRGVEYYEGRTGGWDWFDGERHWWEKFIVWDGGFNGLMKYSCERRWRWNGSSETMRTDHVFLSADQFAAILRDNISRVKGE